MSMNQPFSFGGPPPDMSAAMADPTMQTGNPNFPPQTPTAVPDQQQMQLGQTGPDQPDAPQPQDPQQTPEELTDQHLIILINGLLTKVSSGIQGAQNIFAIQSSIVPLVTCIAELHKCLTESKKVQIQASQKTPDPAFQNQLALKDQQHQHALDLMANMHDEQNNKFNQQLQSQQQAHDQQLAQATHGQTQQQAALEQLMKIVQMHQDQQNHLTNLGANQQQQAQQQEQHQQNISNTDEMHQAQLQQAMNPSPSDISGN